MYITKLDNVVFPCFVNSISLEFTPSPKWPNDVWLTFWCVSPFCKRRMFLHCLSGVSHTIYMSLGLSLSSNWSSSLWPMAKVVCSYDYFCIMWVSIILRGIRCPSFMLFSSSPIDIVGAGALTGPTYVFIFSSIWNLAPTLILHLIQFGILLSISVSSLVTHIKEHSGLMIEKKHCL